MKKSIHDIPNLQLRIKQNSCHQSYRSRCDNRQDSRRSDRLQQPIAHSAPLCTQHSTKQKRFGVISTISLYAHQYLATTLCPARAHPPHHRDHASNFISRRNEPSSYYRLLASLHLSRPSYHLRSYAYQFALWQSTLQNFSFPTSPQSGPPHQTRLQLTANGVEPPAALIQARFKHDRNVPRYISQRLLHTLFILYAVSAHIFSHERQSAMTLK